ncbi:MAG: hypothetical protein Q8P02_01145, partial [Candidatus Micrarchaeota archaeon]|nr:hypothetical protein [Candidatus Micrarchaeota archaeon]
MKSLAFLLFFSALFFVPVSAITELNCNSICGGAFCQDSFGSPSIADPNFPPASTTIKYSTESPALLERFGSGVFCGAFTTSKCIVSNACLSGSGPGPAPTCASFSIELSQNVQQSGQPPAPDDYWGYNWTDQWLSQCGSGPDGEGNCHVPSRQVRVACRDTSGTPMPCPEQPVFSASVGTIEPDSFNNDPDARIWKSVNFPTPVTITASMSACGGGTASRQFNLHILNACRLNPASATLEVGESQVFSGMCQDENG